MFSKRIKYVRDMFQEVDILSKKAEREISKLNDNIESEIKKKLRKYSPGIQVTLLKLESEDFQKKQKRTIPVRVLIESINGRKVHEKGFWVDEMWEPASSESVSHKLVGLIKTENVLTVEELSNVCFELSENLDIDIDIQKISGKVNY
jgi:hypothetical protein